MSLIGAALTWITLGCGLIMVVFDWSTMEVPFPLVVLFWTLFGLALFFGIARHGLTTFFIKRVLTSFFVLFIITSLCFVLLRLLPGGPFDEEKALPLQVKNNIEHKYGLDLPLPTQYFKYLAGVVQGDLGYSYKYEGKAVGDIIKECFPISFKLGFYALVFAYLLGVPVGLIAARHHGQRLDRLLMGMAISGIALPSFLLAPVLIYIFSFGWPFNFYFPGFYESLMDKEILLPAALWNSPRHYILPVITLGFRPAAFIARLTRSSVLDVIHSDFVRTAKSKGLSERVVLFHHVLRNSLVPLLSYSGPMVAGILSGSFIVEVIFAIPGIAKYLVQGVFNRDYPLIMGLTLLFSLILILANLLVDILYKVVDPRIEIK